MNLRMLRTFVEVVRQGGFSQAAPVVCLTQSTVSKAVKALEDDLGLPLLNRLGQGVELTAAGEILYRRALVLLAEQSDLLAELEALRGLKQGRLRIGLPPVGSGALFAALFATFRQRYPELDVELVEQGGQRLAESLAAGEVDLAAILMPVPEEFDYQEVRSEPLMVVLPARHPLAGRQRLDIRALATEPFILFEAGFALNAKILAACALVGVVPRVGGAQCPDRLHRRPGRGRAGPGLPAEGGGEAASPRSAGNGAPGRAQYRMAAGTGLAPERAPVPGRPGLAGPGEGAVRVILVLRGWLARPGPCAVGPGLRA
ncbi:DNA-binding transcriptional LysR family regulator [Pseudomonas psychrotolerans]|uniref:DNA-binding transcriptional LysR family regulator n=1 Tax=Pseudomonas oryzihabitans TaxID=47885 RepID=A0AAJ2BUF2_9PSED|nr:DNA-binding transcriptional LysR family regulator [Pseudomonas psychrotolerans]